VPRPELDARSDVRVERMWAAGLVDEVRALAEVGLRDGRTASRALGYAQVLHLLDDLNQDGLAIVLTTHDLNGMAAHLPHLLALRPRVIASGSPSEVIVPSVVEEVFGAGMEILQHLGIPVVVDHVEDNVRRLPAS
jgi:ABC-type hemin transport system ATPase subunit